MAPEAFVPDGFEPPTSLGTDQFRLESLGPQHTESELLGLHGVGPKAVRLLAEELAAQGKSLKS